jgi:hypothetical protein
MRRSWFWFDFFPFGFRVYGPFMRHWRRAWRFPAKEEYIEMLKEYKEELLREKEEIEEEIGRVDREIERVQREWGE